jgi:hypothetical protein
MVKFNLQKHLEQFHTAEERNTKATELIKVSYHYSIVFQVRIMWSFL